MCLLPVQIDGYHQGLPGEIADFKFRVERVQGELEYLVPESEAVRAQRLTGTCQKDTGASLKGPVPKHGQFMHQTE